MTTSTCLEDLRLVAEHARRQPGTDPARVWLHGESYGGLLSCVAAAQAPERYAGLILWYPALVVPEASRERERTGDHTVFGLRLSPDFDRLAMRIDPWTPMPRFNGPVLLLHGEADDVVPCGCSRRAASLYPRAELVTYPGAGHGYDGEALRDALRRSAAKVLEAGSAPIMTLDVHITQVLETCSPSGTARLVLFDGTAEGPLFRGRILPGGVDTQLERPDGSGTLSARYMLEGIGLDGQPARVFIENRAVMGQSETAPCLRTDSPALAFLERMPLKGELSAEDGKLTIRILAA